MTPAAVGAACAAAAAVYVAAWWAVSHAAVALDDALAPIDDD